MGDVFDCDYREDCDALDKGDFTGGSLGVKGRDKESGEDHPN